VAKRSLHEEPDGESPERAAPKKQKKAKQSDKVEAEAVQAIATATGNAYVRGSYPSRRPPALASG
jgi:hypothetical protein